MRTRNRESSQQEIAPEPQPATESGAEDVAARARSLLDLGDDLIRSALSNDSRRFLAQNRQQGGE